jgi:hypothetical protein
MSDLGSEYDILEEEIKEAPMDRFRRQSCNSKNQNLY